MRGDETRSPSLVVHLKGAVGCVAALKCGLWNQVRVSFRVRGDIVVLFEERVHLT